MTRVARQRQQAVLTLLLREVQAQVAVLVLVHHDEQDLRTVYSTGLCNCSGSCDTKAAVL